MSTNRTPSDSEISWIRRLGNAVYLLLFAIAAILFLVQYFITDDSVRNVLINLASELTAITLVFFLVNKAFGLDLEERRQRRMDDLAAQLEGAIGKVEKSDLEIYTSREAIYDSGIGTLKKHYWDIVRVFAPVGLWNEDEAKKRWLVVLAEYARTKKVGTVRLVFGLPPKNKYGEVVPRDQVLKNVEHARKLLGLFDGMNNVSLHFYPPPHASVGLGAIIFQGDDNVGEVAFGLASNENEDVVDRAFGTNNKSVFLFAKQWFDDRIFYKATGAFVLQDDTTTLTQRWQDVIRAWYYKDYTPG